MRKLSWLIILGVLLVALPASACRHRHKHRGRCHVASIQAWASCLDWDPPNWSNMNPETLGAVDEICGQGWKAEANFFSLTFDVIDLSELPESAMVTGIQVDFWSKPTSAALPMNWRQLRFRIGGGPVSHSKLGYPPGLVDASESITQHTYGGPNDLWGYLGTIPTWRLRAGELRIWIELGAGHEAEEPPYSIIYIDAFRVSVYYELPESNRPAEYHHRRQRQ